MKMNTIMEQKIGNKMPKVFKGYLTCIAIYFVITILYYIYDALFTYTLHAANKPLVLYLVKWMYSFVVCIAIIKFKNKPSFYWQILLAASFGLILLYCITNMNLVFYGSPVEQFLLEVMSICLIITLHTKFLRQYYNFSIKPYYYLSVIVPISITILVNNYIL